MSDRPIDVKVGAGVNSTATEISDIPTPEELAEHRKRLTRVLDRGILVDRLAVDLPPHLHGEWVPRDPFSQAHYEMLGFQVDTEYATRRKLNDAGDGSPVVGDVIFMVQPMWKHKEYARMRKEVYDRTHKTAGGKQKEEQDFEDSNTAIGMPSIVESQVQEKRGDQLAEALKPQS